MEQHSIIVKSDQCEESTPQIPQKNGVCVKIYVAEHCQMCGYAYEIAATIRDNYPDVALQIVDMGNPSEQIPENVFATPTYLLNGRVWSLGNPSLDQVNETLNDIVNP